MGDPYRTGGGTPCPRCKRPLLHEDGEERCTDGCGTWLPNSILATLLDPATLPSISRGNPFRATALSPTKCLVCRGLMNDLYQGAVDTLVLGQCALHGIWIEAADRDTFESMYSATIGTTRKQRREAEAEEAARAERLHDDPAVADLIRRVRALEAEVAELKRGK
jgi:hypothetical protein